MSEWASSRGLSLANKCQLLFGGAVVLIVSAALVYPWIRIGRIVDAAQLESSRHIAELWTDSPLIDPELSSLFRAPEEPGARAEASNLSMRWWPIEAWRAARFADGFLDAARRSITEGPDARVEHAEALWVSGDRLYRYARLVLTGDGEPLGVVVVDRRSVAAASQLLVNRLLLVVSGILAGAVAVAVFYFITTKIILRPVRALKGTADLVREGNLQIRSDLRTGDEFEQLAEAFNSMLSTLSEQQQQLRGMNKSLDMRLSELQERNSALREAARLKGEFLASISHELRTPLNSIIGFAEILQDIARTDAEREGDDRERAPMVKRRRYLDNIVTAGRGLLEMINELLAMAKIEAGKIELHVQPVNVGETCEALAALIRPLAERKGQALTLQLQAASSEGGFTSDPGLCDLPSIDTDQQKFHHVVFNFLSNAVKFTPEGGRVTLRADRVVGGDGEPRVRVSVLDTGPGIPADRRAFIFEKFSQLDAGHTRTHQGTGLGLAIAREYAELLQGEIELVSEVGRGSMFSLVLPRSVDAAGAEATRRRMIERAAGARVMIGAGSPSGAD